jgi:hypothetical protein
METREVGRPSLFWRQRAPLPLRVHAPTTPLPYLSDSEVRISRLSC